MTKLLAATAIAGLALLAASSAHAARASFSEGTCPGWGTPVCKKWSCTGPVTSPNCTCTDFYCKVNGAKAGVKAKAKNLSSSN